MAVAPLVPGWWRPLAVVGAGIGIAAFAVFWDGQTRLLFEEGAIGVVVSAILLGHGGSVSTGVWLARCCCSGLQRVEQQTQDLKLTPAEDDMSRVLVLYGTTEGHTARSAGAIADALRAQGIEVDAVEAGMDDPRADDYAGVVVAASVHASRYQRLGTAVGGGQSSGARGKAVRVRLDLSGGSCNGNRRCRREVNAIVDRFLMTTGWRPMWTKSVAGALRYTKYGWLTRWIMQRIAAKAGGDTDTTRDYEYTDWQDVRAFAERFGRVVVAPVLADRHDSPPHTQAA